MIKNLLRIIAGLCALASSHSAHAEAVIGFNFCDSWPAPRVADGTADGFSGWVDSRPDGDTRNPAVEYFMIPIGNTGVSIRWESKTTWAAGSENNNEQALYRVYLDDGWVSSRGGVFVHISGLTQWMVKNGVSQYSIRCYSNNDAANTFQPIAVRAGTESISTLLQTITPLARGNGDYPTAGTLGTGQSRGYGDSPSPLTANEFSLQIPPRDGNIRGTLAAIKITGSGPPMVPPVIKETTLASITPTSSTFRITANAMGNPDVYATVAYGSTSGYGNYSSSQSLAGSSDTTVSCTVGALPPNTTYHYRCEIYWAGGVVAGEDRTFTTPPPYGKPTVTLTNTSVTGSTLTNDARAQITGTVNPNSGTTSVYLAYGSTPACLGGTIPVASALTGYTPLPISATSLPLAAGVPFYFLFNASNSFGSSKSEVVMITPPDPPALADLTVDGGTLDSPLASGGSSYGVRVNTTGASVRFRASANNPADRIRINGTLLQPGDLSPPVADGDWALWEVENPTTGLTRTYRFFVHGPQIALVLQPQSQAPIAVDLLDATATRLDLKLAFTPQAGTVIPLVDNTGLLPMSADFSNLPHGQVLELTHNNNTTRFVANYYGGDGNDLVLQPAHAGMFTWGINIYSQLGNGSPPGNPHSSAAAVRVTPDGVLAGRIPIKVFAGATHSFAICADGEIAAWGVNTYGKLGSGSTGDTAQSPVLVNRSGVLAGKRVVQLACGDAHSLALCSDGTLVGWGNNTYRQIGPANTYTNNPNPVLVPMTGSLAGKRPIAIAASGNTSLALCSDGTVAIWGLGSQGQYGNGSSANSTDPTQPSTIGILAGRKVKSVAMGTANVLALCTDGTIATWGASPGGLGNGTSSSTSPVLVDPGPQTDINTIHAIHCGSTHSFLWTTDQKILAWGMNDSLQTGTGSSPLDVPRPQPLLTDTYLDTHPVRKIAAGKSHSYALCADGSVAAWGGPGPFQAMGENFTSTSTAIPFALSFSQAPSGGRAIDLASSGYGGLVLLGFPNATASTLAATQIGPQSATLNGQLDPAGSTTTVHFEYGPTPQYGQQVTLANPPTTSGSQQISAEITGLTPGETIHYRIIAVSPGGTTRGNDMTFTPGHPPSFTGFTASTPWQTQASIPVQKILAKATDPDGGMIQLTLATSTSTHGGTVTIANHTLLYTPPAGFSGIDTIDFNLNNPGGLSNTGTLTLAVGSPPGSITAATPSLNPPRLSPTADGKMAILFQGIPGRRYLIQRATANLNQWTTLASATADAAGRVTFTDPAPPPDSAFYRIAQSTE